MRLLKAGKQMMIKSPQYKDHQWEIYPFLFEVKEPTIKLNWENSEFRWIDKDQLYQYKTVPSLDEVLFNLL